MTSATIGGGGFQISDFGTDEVGGMVLNTPKIKSRESSRKVPGRRRKKFKKTNLGDKKK